MRYASSGGRRHYQNIFIKKEREALFLDIKD